MDKPESTIIQSNDIGKDYLSSFNITSIEPLKLEGYTGTAKYYFNSDEHFFLEVPLQDGRKNGEGIISKDGVIYASLTFVDDRQNGKMVEYQNGTKHILGYLLNGQREGIFREIDSNENIVNAFAYDRGKYLGEAKPSTELSGAWDIISEGELIERCYVNADFRRDGICQFFSNSQIQSVRYYHDNAPIAIQKSFDKNIMKEYDETGKSLIYEGEYDENSPLFLRNGMGKEIRDGKTIYNGLFVNNVRSGEGKMFETFGTYIGNWEKGYPSGKGRFIKNGKQYNGNWEFGYLHTEGKWLDYATGEFEEANSSNELAHWKERGGNKSELTRTIFSSGPSKASRTKNVKKLDKPGSAKKKLWFTIIGIVAIIIIIIIIVLSITLGQSKNVVVSSYQQFIDLNSDVQSITIRSRTCNEIDFTTFDIDRFTELQQLIIQSSSLQQLRSFTINQLNLLQSIIIESDVSSINQGSFRISNCNSLTSIQIDSNSFTSFNEFYLLSSIFIHLINRFTYY